MAKAEPGDKKKTQRERFIETAKALEVDETGQKFEDAFKRVAPPKRPENSEDS